MKINILHRIEGAKEARGCAVIIDVFRAMTVEAYLAKSGAARVIPVGDKELAYQYKKENHDAILIGEREGRKLPGFDYGNSPSEIENANLSGLSVVHTTSAGTQGIANATGADEIILGSLVCASAIARYIKDRGFEEVSLVCMGLMAREETEEDNLCARYIKDLLCGGDTSYIKDEIEDLKKTSGAKFFDLAQNSVFPERDFYLSTEVDKFDFVLRIASDSDGVFVEKINV